MPEANFMGKNLLKGAAALEGHIRTGAFRASEQVLFSSSFKPIEVVKVLRRLPTHVSAILLRTAFIYYIYFPGQHPERKRTSMRKLTIKIEWCGFFFMSIFAGFELPIPVCIYMSPNTIIYCGVQCEIQVGIDILKRFSLVYFLLSPTPNDVFQVLKVKKKSEWKSIIKDLKILIACG